MAPFAAATTTTVLAKPGYPSWRPLDRCKPSATATMSTWSGRTAAMALGRRELLEERDEEWRRYLAPERQEVLAHLEPWAEANMLPLLKPADSAWQPSDFLPDAATLGGEGFAAACAEVRARAELVPDALLVCLVGNMVTEEALPTYHAMSNRFEATRDATGSGGDAWARWLRGWSAEENRHGDLLSRYCYLSGRVDMRRVERTVHALVANGMPMHAPASAHHGYVYVAFQERATAVSHGNTARKAGACGDPLLARICGAVAGDEKRHEAAYTRLVARIFECDADAAVRAMAYMMRRRITMPAALMDDGGPGGSSLFARYAAAASQAGVYTAADYRAILEHLIREWKVEELAAGLSGEGRRARDYVCALPDKIRRMEEKAFDRTKKKPSLVPFSWIFDRPVSLVLP
ncbi:acyl-[acyl-carrier-protein] desaturase 7, chloroplastic isoform X2 [Brachypodium distachyon]|uniref:acyl-[acyl-carrier-protein] desaturase 7, chloroplastic isoform X2 n=1 Tax=Brachypodium distachyon TaxID=15368 RepID=UPI00071CF0EB|nr:acyl-[acyl-carrier-protein] desaturase 7, chloroplastic isoform X2 [Brachypodium distachyon]|eukprot:XP_014755737.1 acyl-[acyl-carrier-protein] desaturase 7, chloroplastic isoform X2 [Brachypodium distachyon]